MYQRILVALDGTPGAEHVLPHVEALAQRFGAAVALLHVTTSATALLAETSVEALPSAGPVLDPTPIVEAEEEEGEAYLDGVAARLRQHGLQVSCEQVEGEPGDAIVEHARRTQADLVAMVTHGRSGLGRLLFGSVTEDVLRHAPCPVLVVRVHDRRG